MDLDDVLTAAAPAVTPRTPQLHQELEALVMESEAVQRRGRRGVRMAVVGSVVAGVLGLGTVASATGILPGWALLGTASGQTCEVQVHAGPLRAGDGEPISATFSSAQQEESLAAAEAFLRSFDYESMDHRKAIAEWRAAESKVRHAQKGAAEGQPRLKGDDLEVTAVTHAVVERMRSELAADGLDIRAINVWVSSRGCEQ